MLADGGTNSIGKVGGDVTISTKGQWSFGISAQNGGRNIIGGDGGNGVAGKV